MPQLCIETFPSQILWVLVGFIAVYAIVSSFIAPQIEETFELRSSHIDDLLKRSETLKIEATAIEMKALTAFEEVQFDAMSAETKLVTAFRDRSNIEKNALNALFSKRMKKESANLTKASDNVREEICGDLDDLIEIALGKIRKVG